MDRQLIYFFPLLLLLPFGLSGLAYRKFITHKRIEFRHLSEFYLSLSLFMTCSWWALPLGGAFTILSMLSWIWILRSFGLVTGDISGQVLFSRYHYYALALGGVISLIFMSFVYPLAVIATPFALSIGLIGLTFIFQSYSSKSRRGYSFQSHLNLLLILCFFISKIVFPTLVAIPSRLQMIGVIDIYFVLIFCTCLYPLYSEIIFEGREKMLEKVLQTRNRQLLTHSGFSEYRILAAGLSHELNNALTIINAKLTRLIRNYPDIENDLLVIHRASNRIVTGIRGLREFIYPREGLEVLDLNLVINEVLRLYGQRLINHGVKVDVHGMEGKLFKGQRVLIDQIFLSLINNSVDALDTLEEKWINISARSSGHFIEISYEDSSRSRAESIIPLLANPFYSFHEFRDNDIRLLLVKDITERYGGSMECKIDTQNSVFVIRLPEEETTQSTDSRLESKIDDAMENRPELH